MTGRVLIVDDDPAMRRVLEINLAARGYQVDTAASGRSALDLTGGPLDLIILDLNLPDMDGLDVLHQVRASSMVPIVVVSGQDVQTSGGDALAAGADDYVVKPFSMDDLVGRIRAAVRTSEPPAGNPLIVTDDFAIDLVARRVTRNDVVVPLSASQWHLVETLARHRGQLVTRRRLLDEVWGPGCAGKTYHLGVCLALVREKLEPDPSRPAYFLTEPDRGYRLSV
jgi:two-component system, OmpR family, KDP operon response regulator KdpE